MTEYAWSGVHWAWRPPSDTKCRWFVLCYGIFPRTWRSSYSRWELVRGSLRSGHPCSSMFDTKLHRRSLGLFLSYFPEHRRPYLASTWSLARSWPYVRRRNLGDRYWSHFYKNNTWIENDHTKMKNSANRKQFSRPERKLSAQIGSQNDKL